MGEILDPDPGGNKLTGNQLNKSRKLEEKIKRTKFMIFKNSSI